MTMTPSGRALARVHIAAEAMRAGRAILITDDAERENEADLVVAAEHATPGAVSLVLRHSSGLLCVAMRAERLSMLDLPQMVGRNEDPRGTAFAVSVDAAEGVTTGVSASDRALTIQLLSHPETSAAQLRRPGHVFPLQARPGGVLERRGHTEAAVDLALLAGCHPAALLAEAVTDDHRHMLRGPGVAALARRLDLPLLSIADLVICRNDLDEGGLPVPLNPERPTTARLGMRSSFDFETVL